MTAAKFRETLNTAPRCGYSGTQICGLYVYVSNPRLLFDLQFFLWRVGCASTQLDTHELEVQLPGAPSDEQAQREVALYIELWRGRKAFSDVEVSVGSSELDGPSG